MEQFRGEIMESQLSAFRFGQPTNDTPLVTRMFDGLLDTCKGLLTQGFFEANVKLLTRVGTWGLPVAAAVGLIFAMTLAIRLDTLSVFLYGFVWVLLVAIVQYAAVNFSTAGDGLIKTAPSQMSTPAFLNTFALLTLVAGWLLLFGGLFLAIKTEDMKTLWLGLGSFLLGEYLACIAMNPPLTNVTINPRITPAEEAVGILAFLLKALLRLVPIAFGVGIVIGNFSLLVDFYNFLTKKTGSYGTLEAAGRSASLVLDAGLLPLAGFVMFAILYLLIHLVRAVLAVPGKLDVLSRQLPPALDGARAAGRD
jgi:hypothetical protein